MNNYSKKLEQQQLELKAHRESFARLVKTVERNERGGRASISPHSRKLMAEAVRVVADEISIRKHARVGQPLKQYRFLEHHGVLPKEAAYLCVKTAIDLLSVRTSGREQGHAVLCRKIGGLVEDHARMLSFKRQEASLLHYAKAALGKLSSPGRARRRKHYLAAEKAAGLAWKAWPLKQKQDLGLFLMHCFRIRTGLVDFPLLFRYGKSYKVTQLTEGATAWMMELLKEEAQHCSITPPCVALPRKWEGVFGGGYHTEALRFPAIALHSSKFLKDADAVKQSAEFDCLNVLQATRWSVNSQISAFIQQLLEDGVEIAGIPGPEKPVPEYPFPEKIPTSELTEAQAEVLRQYRSAARGIHESNSDNRSIRLHLIRCLQACREFSSKKFSYVYYSDFRGRKYNAYSPLSPQGPDFSRASLQFATALPVDNDEAELMLASHGAAMHGHDKVSLQDRLVWVRENEDRIVRCSEDPLSEMWWSEADKPFQFLAFAHDWSGYLKAGRGYESRLPVQMDGSNNGLQHFSALMLDPVGAGLTNLTPFPTPQDVYQAVADKVQTLVQEDAAAGDLMASGWLDWGITRKLVKRPVMILPYGGTPSAMRRYVCEVIEDGLSAGKPYPWITNKPRPDGWREAGYLAAKINLAIGSVMRCANDVMDWVRGAARTYASAQLPLTWETPSGFRVAQNYLKVSSRVSQTILDGSLVSLRYPEETDEIMSRRAVQGSSPNYIHSLDAAHLTHTVLAAQERGISDMMVIHDCFAVHATHAAALSTILREQFVDLHTPHRLQELKHQFERYGPTLPDVPERGDLDISSVLDSEYLFA